MCGADFLRRQPGLRRGDAVFVLDLDALNRRIVGVDRCQHAVAQEGGQRMLRQRRHGAGLDVGGQAGFDADAVFRQEVHQCRIFDRFHPVTDTLGAQLADRLPDAFRAGGFARVHGDAQAGVARAVEVVEEQAAGEAQLIARQIQRGNAVAVRQQPFQFLQTGGLAKGAAHDADQANVDVAIAAARTDPVDHCFHHAGDRQLVLHRHVVRGKTQLGVVQAGVGGVFDVFVGHAAAGVQIAQHRHAPVQFCRKLTRSGSAWVICTCGRRLSKSLAGRARLNWRPRSRMVCARILPSRWR